MAAHQVEECRYPFPAAAAAAAWVASAWQPEEGAPPAPRPEGSAFRACQGPSGEEGSGPAQAAGRVAAVAGVCVQVILLAAVAIAGRVFQSVMGVTALFQAAEVEPVCVCACSEYTLTGV